MITSLLFIRLQILAVVVDLHHIEAFDVALLHKVSRAVHQTPPHASVEPRLVFLVEFVKHQPQLGPVEGVYDLSDYLLEVLVELALALEAELGEAIVVLGHILCVHLLVFGFEFLLKVNKEVVGHVSSLRVRL